MDTHESRVLDDDLWEELIELTDGAASPCFQCGVCTASCPWGLVRDETIIVRDLVRRAQLGINDGQESLWLCTACAQCEAYCPRDVPIAEVLRGLRYMLWKRRKSLDGLPSMLWSVYWNNNPLFQPPSQRMGWAKELDIPIFDPSRDDLLLYIGCTSSYDRRSQRISKALANILQHAGVTFGVIGEDEPCCGEAVLSVGHRPYFEEVAERAAQVFKARSVSRLMTVSPHCYDVFLNEYTSVHESFFPMHYTQVLDELLTTNRLVLRGTLEERVTYQDPCFLGRRNQSFEAPRRILESIKSLEFVEMEHSREDALCCGGGGGRMWMETPANERFSDMRVREAVGTDASLIATSCPYCVACLEDSIKALKIPNLRVLDIAEIVSEVLL